MEINGLGAIASQAADPEHLYGTDEDAGFGASVSIRRCAGTIRRRSLGWARGRVALINGLFDSLETRVVAPGQGYARLRSVVHRSLSDRWYALLVTTKYLGGATVSRDHAVTQVRGPPLANVPAAQQRAALAFMAEAAFGEGATDSRPRC